MSPATARTNSFFGRSLTAGHFAGRAAADLAIEAWTDRSVSVIYGSTKGLTAVGDQVWNKNSAGLPRGATAVDADAEVVRPRRLGDLERGADHLLVRRAGEVLLEGATVDPRLAVAGAENHARDGRLALARAEILRDLDHYGSSIGFGAWAACGCSGPA